MIIDDWSDEWDAFNPAFRALFILEDGASVARIWGVKGCTIIAIIYDLGVTEGKVCRTGKIVRRTCAISNSHFTIASNINRPELAFEVGVTRRVASSDDEGLGAQEDASKQGRSRIEAIDKDAEVTLVETHMRNDETNDNLMFDIGVFDGDEIVVEAEEPVIMLLQLQSHISEKDVVQESRENVSTATTMVSTATTIVKSKDKGKEIMNEPEKPLMKKDQMALDEEIAREIEAEGASRSGKISKERAHKRS
ncbi:hypothetical protein Tco_0599097 [Tanacetum coccineum]